MSLSPIDINYNIKVVRQLANKVYPDNKILADMTLVQAILEGALWKAPPSSLALKYNNLFGIKGKGTKGSVQLMTKEFYGGQMHDVKQSFAYNATVEDSVLQHRRVLDLSRYAKVGTSKTFDEAAKAIHAGGYATDNKYPQLLIDTYNKWVVGKGA